MFEDHDLLRGGQELTSGCLVKCARVLRFWMEHYSLTRLEKIAVMAMPRVANMVDSEDLLNLMKKVKFTENKNIRRWGYRRSGVDSRIFIIVTATKYMTWLSQKILVNPQRLTNFISMPRKSRFMVRPRITRSKMT